MFYFSLILHAYYEPEGSPFYIILSRPRLMGQYSLDHFSLLQQKGKQSAVNSVISIYISLGKANHMLWCGDHTHMVTTLTITLRGQVEIL